MRIAISDPDRTATDVLAHAAQTRGHQTVTVAETEELFDRLPFEPAVFVVWIDADDASVPPAIPRIRAAFPQAGLFVTLERPREPLPSRLLQAGAAEVVRVPYNPTELILRVEAWLAGRTAERPPDDLIHLGDLEIALDRYAATKNGVRLDLTRLELRLLYCLCEHQPHLTPTERLLTFGWDTLGDPDPALIKTHISHIRKKLQTAGGVPFEITSRQTLGYVLQVQE